MRLEGEVVHVDEELRQVTVQVLGRVTVDASTVELVRKYRRPKVTTPLLKEASGG